MTVLLSKKGMLLKIKFLRLLLFYTNDKYLYAVRFIKPYRNPVYKCAGLRQGFMKWALSNKVLPVKSRIRYADF